MSDIVIAGLLALAGTLSGTFGGIVVSSKLTAYRIEQLEKKQDKNNCLIDRTYKLEEGQAILCEQVKVVNHRLADLESK